MRCSLVGICLPDEVNYFRQGAAPRPLAVDRELALPVYVQATPARVRKRGETLVIQTEDEKETTARLIDTSHLVLMGAVDVTAPTLHELMRREIPVSWYTGGGWFRVSIGNLLQSLDVSNAPFPRPLRWGLIEAR